jgi:nicotinamide-nucleotide amidase
MPKDIKHIISVLIKKKITISIAESCTGGMLAQTITSVSGASKVFKFGIITYSNQSKIKYLNVPLKIIKRHGSVSKQCCQAMIKNLSKISNAKLNIAITGIAGPRGGSKFKPVGLVYIGIKKGSKIKITEWFFKTKKRKNIRINSVKKSFELISEFI